MRIQILSDLHIEFAPCIPSDVQADVVVLAGDIGVGTEAMRWVGDMFPSTPVIYVAGNHEFYHSSIEATWDALRQACPANVHLLENESIEIGGVRFLGCTLWTDYALFGQDTQLGAMQAVGSALADHRVISVLNEGMPRKFEPRDALTCHVRSRRWLEAELAKDHAGPTVVVTHHAPHRGSLAARFATDPVSAGFVSDLEYLMGRAALWIHGHNHDSFDYVVNDTRVICNPRGYPLNNSSFENHAYDPILVAEPAGE